MIVILLQINFQVFGKFQIRTIEILNSDKSTQKNENILQKTKYNLKQHLSMHKTLLLPNFGGLF